jgi:WD40-like Beta Propeller Repeat
VSTYTHTVKSKKFELSRFVYASIALGIVAAVVTLSSLPLSAPGSPKVTFKPAPVRAVNVISRDGKKGLQGDGTFVDLGTGASVPIPGSYSAAALDRDGSQALLLDTNGRAVRRTVATGVNVAVPVPASWFGSDEISLNAFEPGLAMSGDGSVVAYLHVNSARFLGTRVLITTMTGTPIEVTPHVQTTAVNNEAASLSMSADGRFLAFTWRQFDVGCTTPNELWCTFRVYRYDRSTGTTTRVDVDPNGDSSLGFSGSPAISDNGRFVAFVSDSPTIVAGLSGRKSRLFLRDMRNGITHFVTDMSVATQTSPRVSMSGDGLRVLYEDRGPIAVAGTTYDNSEVIRFADLSDGTLVTIGPSDGSLPNSVLRDPFVNQAGDRFVISGNATNITSPVAPADTGVFVGTLAAAAVLKLTLPSGEQIDLDRDLVSQSPVRVLDTRQGGPVNYSGAKPAAGSVVEVPVPAGAGAAVLNVTGLDATDAGFVTVFPCGEARPNASNLNLVPGVVSPNLVIAKPGANGKVCIFTERPANFFADLAGVFPS